MSIYPYLIVAGVAFIAYVTTEDKTPTALRDSAVWTLALFLILFIAMMA